MPQQFVSDPAGDKFAAQSINGVLQPFGAVCYVVPSGAANFTDGTSGDEVFFVGPSQPLPVALSESQITALTPPTSVALNAGTAKVGQVAIDQTTPGTTNLVQLPASQITALTPPTSVAVSSSALPTWAATAANQVIGNSTLSTIAGYLALQAQLADSLWTDASGAYYVRRDVINESTGAISVSFVTPTGSAATPGSGLVPVNATQNQVVNATFTATAGGTGFSINDTLQHCVVISDSPTPAVLASVWVNINTGAIITAPGGGSITPLSQTISGTVTANAGTNLSTAALALESGGNLATTATHATSLDAKTPNLVGTGSPAVIQDAAGNLVNTQSVGAGQTGLMVAVGSSQLPVNASQETGGNLASIATSVASLNQLEQSRMSSDSPMYVVTSGDPNGDFAGLNPIELAMTDATGIAMNTRTLNPVKTDQNNATVITDAPQPVNVLLAVGQQYVIDTQSYQSVSLTTQTFTGSLACSNDQISWTTLVATQISNGAGTSGLYATNNYQIPAVARYVRLTCTTAGSFTFFLRNVPSSQYETIAAELFIGTTAATNAGAASVLAVGGVTSVGVSATANPNLIGGVDGSGLVRRILTDATGVLDVGGNITPGSAATGNPVPLGGADFSSITRRILTNQSGGIVVDSMPTTQSTQSVPELLYQILGVLKVIAYYEYENPFVSGPRGSADEPDNLLAQFTDNNVYSNLN